MQHRKAITLIMWTFFNVWLRPWGTGRGRVGERQTDRQRHRGSLLPPPHPFFFLFFLSFFVFVLIFCFVFVVVFYSEQKLLFLSVTPLVWSKTTTTTTCLTTNGENFPSRTKAYFSDVKNLLHEAVIWAFPSA